MSDTDRVPDFEMEEERRQIELERLALEQSPMGRVLLHIANRILTMSERLTIHAEDEHREFTRLKERLSALEARSTNGAGP